MSLEAQPRDHRGQAGPVLVIGASGQVGRFLLPRLAARGYAVDALSRHPRPDAVPELDGVRWLDPSEARQRIPRYPLLVSAGPLGLALEYAQAMPALQALAVTSSSSVLSKENSADSAERLQIEGLRQAEEGFRALARKRRLPLTILRPTLVYGCGLDRNLTRYAAFIGRFGFLPVSSRAGGLRQPVHADDVAQALIASLAPRERRELISPLCGGDTIDYRGMVRRIFTALDRTPRLLELPPALLIAMLTTASALRMAKNVNPEMIRRQATNLVFDDGLARSELGVRPRRFRPGPEAFRPPEPIELERLALRR
ncbi:MAG: NAD-dependent epimerase/dehydratase family protein [Xanthomonadales bacterium]|jgi:nucleoside-diphosphate-sugar epimerase|nr:NAD-dependent epimerase/dehydratase family protein [Xanthomonadales bacterium]